jgi:murein DD-endopeptidase MepM/ murein hydrolase activator NlpD
MGPIKKFYTFAQSTILEHLPRGHLIAIGSLTGCLVIASYIDSNNHSDLQTATKVPAPALNASSLPGLPPLQVTTNQPAPAVIPGITPNLDTLNAKPKPEEKPASPWKEFTVQAGDNLSLIFKRAGLNDRDIYELFNSAKDAKDLRSIRPGQKISFLVTNSKLQGLHYVMGKLESVEFTRTTKGFSSNEIKLEPDIKTAFREAAIDSSLYMAAKRAGIPSSLTMELANIFGWDIDFALDIKKGDKFKVMYEEQHLEGKRIGTGKILAAEFTNGGKTFQAVRYLDKDGVGRYYTPEGRGMHKAFLRSPIEFARISSHFSLGRKHPVLHIIRAHKGTDYAARTGTPIRATGDGKIAFAGRKGGYGNCVVINHGQGYETLYGHMNAFAKGMRSGTRVSQGDIIGYVGMTGLASGPHLHYEFHMHGQVRNPVTVPLPKVMGIDKTEMAKFTAQTKNLVAKLDQFNSNTRLALAKSGTKSN